MPTPSPSPESHWFATNRANWDERVGQHLDSPFYDLAGFKQGRCTLRDFDLAMLPDVAGKDLVHLQCHFGLDTLSWARRGARVTGLDFSAPAVAAAQAIALELGIPARFVQANVYDALQALGADFDIVYTGLGALCWLPDLERWADQVEGLLRPGGTLALAEFHPFTDVFGDEDLRVIGFFSKPSVQQIWTEEVWDGEKVTGSPNI